MKRFYSMGFCFLNGGGICLFSLRNILWRSTDPDSGSWPFVSLGWNHEDTLEHGQFRQVFLNLFWFAALHFTSKYQLNSEIGGTPRAFCGTQGFRGTPVENHWFRLFTFTELNPIKLFSLLTKNFSILSC